MVTGSSPRSTDVDAALGKILTDADHRGQVFITDEDARPFGSAQPHAHLWDNGADPAAELAGCLRCGRLRSRTLGPT